MNTGQMISNLQVEIKSVVPDAGLVLMPQDAEQNQVNGGFAGLMGVINAQTKATAGVDVVLEGVPFQLERKGVSTEFPVFSTSSELLGSLQGGGRQFSKTSQAHGEMIVSESETVDVSGERLIKDDIQSDSEMNNNVAQMILAAYAQPVRTPIVDILPSHEVGAVENLSSAVVADQPPVATAPPVNVRAIGSALQSSQINSVKSDRAPFQAVNEALLPSAVPTELTRPAQQKTAGASMPSLAMPTQQNGRMPTVNIPDGHEVDTVQSVPAPSKTEQTTATLSTASMTPAEELVQPAPVINRGSDEKAFKATEGSLPPSAVRPEQQPVQLTTPAIVEKVAKVEEATPSTSQPSKASASTIDLKSDLQQPTELTRPAQQKTAGASMPSLAMPTQQNGRMPTVNIPDGHEVDTVQSVPAPSKTEQTTATLSTASMTPAEEPVQPAPIINRGSDEKAFKATEGSLPPSAVRPEQQPVQLTTPAIVEKVAKVEEATPSTSQPSKASASAIDLKSDLQQPTELTRPAQQKTAGASMPSLAMPTQQNGRMPTVNIPDGHEVDTVQSVPAPSKTEQTTATLSTASMTPAEEPVQPAPIIDRGSDEKVFKATEGSLPPSAVRPEQQPVQLTTPAIVEKVAKVEEATPSTSQPSKASASTIDLKSDLQQPTELTRPAQQKTAGASMPSLAMPTQQNGRMPTVNIPDGHEVDTVQSVPAPSKTEQTTATLSTASMTPAEEPVQPAPIINRGSDEKVFKATEGSLPPSAVRPEQQPVQLTTPAIVEKVAKVEEATPSTSQPSKASASAIDLKSDLQQPTELTRPAQQKTAGASMPSLAMPTQQNGRMPTVNIPDGHEVDTVQSVPAPSKTEQTTATLSIASMTQVEESVQLAQQLVEPQPVVGITYSLPRPFTVSKAHTPASNPTQQTAVDSRSQVKPLNLDQSQNSSVGFEEVSALPEETPLAEQRQEIGKTFASLPNNSGTGLPKSELFEIVTAEAAGTSLPRPETNYLDKGATGIHSVSLQRAFSAGQSQTGPDLRVENGRAGATLSATKENMVSPLNNVKAGEAEPTSDDSLNDGRDQADSGQTPDSRVMAAQLHAQSKPDHNQPLGQASASRANVEQPRQDLPEQVAHQVRERLAQHEVKSGNQQITLTLSPDNLGELKMNLNLQGQRLSVEIVTESHTVRDAILQHSDSLKDSLARQNISVESFDVTSNGRGDGNPGSNQNAWKELSRQKQQQFWTSTGGYDRPQMDVASNPSAYQAINGQAMLDIHY